MELIKRKIIYARFSTEYRSYSTHHNKNGTELDLQPIGNRKHSSKTNRNKQEIQFKEGFNMTLTLLSPAIWSVKLSTALTGSAGGSVVSLPLSVYFLNLLTMSSEW